MNMLLLVLLTSAVSYETYLLWDPMRTRWWSCQTSAQLDPKRPGHTLTRTRDPEIFSCVLEFLYKGDYYPRLTHNELENAHDSKTFDRITNKATILHARTRDEVLRDTVVYCAAEKYGLDDLKQLALRKQGLHVGIPIPIILRSARYAYENTPDSDADLRAHYLVMVIRAREMFKTSGTMEMEMEKGHAWFFDLFVAMCNHINDLEDVW